MPHLYQAAFVCAGGPSLPHAVSPQEDGPEGNLMAPKKNLDRLKMHYKEMGADQIMAEYPFKNLPETFKGLFALDNGVINVPLLLRTLTRLCSFHGAKIYENADVNNMETSEFGVKIEAVDTQTGEKRWVYAKKAALTCGAYVNDVLKPNFGFELNLSMWSSVAGSKQANSPYPATCTYRGPPNCSRLLSGPEGEALPRGAKLRERHLFSSSDLFIIHRDLDIWDMSYEYYTVQARLDDTAL